MPLHRNKHGTSPASGSEGATGARRSRWFLIKILSKFSRIFDVSKIFGISHTATGVSSKPYEAKRRSIFKFSSPAFFEKHIVFVNTVSKVIEVKKITFLHVRDVSFGFNKFFRYLAFWNATWKFNKLFLHLGSLGPSLSTLSSPNEGRALHSNTDSQNSFYFHTIRRQKYGKKPVRHHQKNVIISTKKQILIFQKFFFSFKKKKKKKNLISILIPSVIKFWKWFFDRKGEYKVSKWETKF